MHAIQTMTTALSYLFFHIQMFHYIAHVLKKKSMETQ